jgi:N utilization substance protein A
MSGTSVSRPFKSSNRLKSHSKFRTSKKNPANCLLVQALDWRPSSLVRIRIAGRAIQFISLFERLTGVFPRDCVINKGGNEIIFIVQSSQMGKVIGKGGTRIGRLREELARDVRVIQHANSPELCAANALKPARIQKAIVEKLEGKQVLRVIVASDWEKSRVVGRQGQNINRARLLLRRYFGIHNILVTVLPDQLQPNDKRGEEVFITATSHSYANSSPMGPEKVC